MVRKFCAGALLIVGIGLIVFFYDDLYLIATNRDTATVWLARYGAYSPLLFVLLQALQVIAAPIPGEVTGVVGGYLYGTWWGFAYSTVGLTIGSCVAFFLARACGEPLVEKFIAREKLQKYDNFLRHKGLLLASLLFVLPGFPKDALCYILGLSHLRWTHFLVVCTLGRILGTIGLSLSGAMIRDAGNVSIGMVVGLAVVVLALAVVFWKRDVLQKLAQKRESKGGEHKEP